MDATIKLRKAFKAFQYGNNQGFGSQSSPFDKWSYQLSSKTLLDMQEPYVAVSSQLLIDYWKKRPKQKTNNNTILRFINKFFETKTCKGKKIHRDNI